MTPETGPTTEQLPLLPKRKKFLIPVIILLSVTLVGSIAGLFIGIASVRNSGAFKATMMELEQDPAVKQHVGLPLETGWLVIGKHEERDGTYDLTFKIEGPAGEAAVRSRCERGTKDEPWQVTFLDIGVGGRDGDVITIVGDPDFPPGSTQ